MKIVTEGKHFMRGAAFLVIFFALFALGAYLVPFAHIKPGQELGYISIVIFLSAYLGRKMLRLKEKEQRPLNASAKTIVMLWAAALGIVLLFVGAAALGGPRGDGLSARDIFFVFAPVFGLLVGMTYEWLNRNGSPGA